MSPSPRSRVTSSPFVRALALVVATLAAGGCAASLPPEAGAVPPEVRVRSTAGTFDTSAYQGKPVVLEFWATTCEFCRALAPRMQQVHQQIAAQGGSVLGLTMQEDSMDRARSIARGHGMEFPIALAPQELVEAFNVRAVPFVVVIDRGGRVVRYFRGTPDDRELDEALARAAR